MHRWYFADGSSIIIMIYSYFVYNKTYNKKGRSYDAKKWNESGFRPPLCTYRLNWARRTSWGWWDDWEDTVLQTQDSKFGHGGSPQYWLSHVDGEETFFVSFKPPGPGTEPRTLAWKAAVLTTTLGPPPSYDAMFYTCKSCHIRVIMVPWSSENLGTWSVPIYIMPTWSRNIWLLDGMPVWHFVSILGLWPLFGYHLMG